MINVALDIHHDDLALGYRFIVHGPAARGSATDRACLRRWDDRQLLNGFAAKSSTAAAALHNVIALSIGDFLIPRGRARN